MKMFLAKYIMKDRVLKLKNINKAIKEGQEDIQQDKSKVFANLCDIRLALEECRTAYYREREYALMFGAVCNVMSMVRSIEEAEILKETIDAVTSIFEDFDYNQHHKSDAKYEYHALNYLSHAQSELVNPIMEVMNRYSRNLTVFEPNCGDGALLESISAGKANVITYGTEETNKISLAREVASKIGKGALKGSKIKNEAFDVLIAKCSIYGTLEENMKLSIMSKAEKEFLLSVVKYLRVGGIALLVIPFYRMHKDICEHIAKNYDNVQIYKSTGDHWETGRYLYIYAQKSSDKNMDDNTYNRLRRCYNPENIEPFTNAIELNYNLPNSHIAIDLFKGSIIDMEELHDIVNNSGALDAFFDAQKVEKVGESSTKPLLPFNIGQLGLVLTSGCLDGVIDEGDGHYHLVKGKVSKRSEMTSEIEDGVINESETISNRVEINVLLPTGEFKTLT